MKKRTYEASNAAKRQICTVLKELMTQKPLNRITVAEIMRGCGMARQHFYYHFDDVYDAVRWIFEEEAVAVIDRLFQTHDYVVMCGGSMMYVDAVCKGIDQLPTISDDVRRDVARRLAEDGADAMREELRRLDPVYYEQVDLNNVKRVAHAVEICLQSGKPYSSLRTGIVKQRPFRIVKIGLNLPRQELFDRINRRVEKMVGWTFRQPWRGCRKTHASTPRSSLRGMPRTPACIGLPRPTTTLYAVLFPIRRSEFLGIAWKKVAEMRSKCWKKVANSHIKQWKKVARYA